MNLYIIGNGFDIDHDIASKYTDFKQFLSQSGDKNAKTLLEIIEVAYRETKTDLWRDLEASIGKLDLDYAIKKDDSYIVQSITFTNNFSYLFRSWINNIENVEIPNVISKEPLNELFNKNEDIFFTFNYTHTLEEIYNINKNNIKYIHVIKDGVGYEFGHEKVESNNTIGHDSFGFKNFLNQQLIKDTPRIYKDNQSWFEKLFDKNIESIYFYGFSFADIDLIYIKGILNNIDENKLENIYLYNYEGQNENEYEQQENILNNLITDTNLHIRVDRFQI
ncbi:AbiH family protein [Mammaliicoccus lentus]|uniref:AbiH family protein n=1 Tax=Mammaliicoccus lentus TaxID=42858 RepID=UPI0007D9DD37|nr:AbiH family protein [Mammaliicoccus lentus]OAO24891.1 hypothetical protein AXY34_02930 [Mammaliicoccus lentus]